MRSSPEVVSVAVRLYRSIALLLVTFSATTSFAGFLRTQLINANLVVPKAFEEVVAPQDEGEDVCTGTIVGPQAIVTAAHCVSNTSDEMTFKFQGKEYIAVVTINPSYDSSLAEKNFDVAMGYVTEKIVGVHPMSIGGKAAIGDKLQYVGFGCHAATPTKVWDGEKREISVAITDFEYPNVITVSKEVGCEGDSGGPAFVKVDKRNAVYAILSQADNTETTISSMLDAKENQEFLKTWAKDNSVEICGVTKTCK